METPSDSLAFFEYLCRVKVSRLNTVLRVVAESFKMSPCLCVLWAFFTATIAVMFVVMPRYVDDFWYAENIRPWIEGDAVGSPLPAIAETWRFHYLTDNARLPNVLIVPLLLLPKWVGSLPAALALGVAAMWLCAMTARRTTLFASAVAMLMMAYCLPWYDVMGSEDLHLNYQVTTLLAVWCVAVFLGRGGVTGVAGAFALGLLTGAWHEGFALPLVAGMGAACVLWPRYRRSRSLSLSAGLVAGLVWLLSCPSFFNRAAGAAEIFTLGRLAFVAASHPAVILALALTVATLASSRRRQMLANPLFVILLVSAVASVGIQLVATRTPRTGWWGEFSSIFIVVYFLRHLAARRAAKAAACLMLAVAFLHQGLADYYSFVIRHDFDRAIANYRKPAPEPYFADYVTEHEAPLAAWFAPDFNLFTSRVNRKMVKDYYHPDDSCEFDVIPEELRMVTMQTGTALGGNTGARVADGHIFMPDPGVGCSGEFDAAIDYGLFTKSGVRVFYIPFTSQADGRRYLYLYPWRAIIEYRLGRPTAIYADDTDFAII